MSPTTISPRPGTAGARAARAARGAVVALGSRATAPSSVLVSDQLGSWQLGTGPKAAEIEVLDLGVYLDLLRRGSVGFGRAYVEGRIRCDDLTAAVRVMSRCVAGPLRPLDKVVAMVAPLADMALARRAPGRERDRRNISSHYDLSNEFFALMLDETMAYSCAIFEPEGISLHEAQLAKFDRICDLLELRPGERVLEIGTGWGGLAIHLASTRLVQVTTTTISAEQAREARRRVADAGLTGQVEVVESDWRDLAGSYDKIVSVEMIEAVDWRLHVAFFSALSRLLRPGGRALIQAITIEQASYDRARLRPDFIREMVFPGGCLPSVPALRRAVTAAGGLEWVEIHDIGAHYAHTLRCWSANLARHDAEVAMLGLPATTTRLFELYLAYCEGAFLEGHISDVQLLLERPAPRT